MNESKADKTHRIAYCAVLLITCLLSSSLVIALTPVTNQIATKSIQVSNEGHNFNNIVAEKIDASTDNSIRVETNIIYKTTVTGISPKQYRDDLNAQEKELKTTYKATLIALKTAHSLDKKQALKKQREKLAARLANVRKEKTNQSASFDEKVIELQKQIDDLNQYRVLFSQDEIRTAQIALANGNETKAKIIFEKIAASAKVFDKPAALAEFNLGKMAEDRIDYSAAYSHFQMAVRRIDDNPLYLYRAGQMAQIVARYDQSIAYYEAILVLIKHKEKYSSKITIAKVWNNLGLAWNSKGQYDKAIAYYEKASASLKLNLGENHPTTVIVKNNLNFTINAAKQTFSGVID